MRRKFQGYAHCVDGVLDVDWDISTIEDAHYLTYAAAARLDMEERNRHLAARCMVNVDPEFRKNVRTGDFLVGNRGVGWGHGHDQAILALKVVGINAVICETTTMTFKRNCLNHGVPIIEIPGIFSQTHTGDFLELDLDEVCLKNSATGVISTFAPYPEFILEILDHGGIYPKLRRELAENNK